jgi:hypothetical protein
MSLVPAPAQLLAQPLPPAGNQFVFQLQGQSGIPYVIQNSTNLMTWTPVSTNIGTVNFTNPVNPSLSAQFWRAVWQP